MTATLAPALVDGLIATLTPALPAVDVIDGYAFSQDEGTVLTVGVSSGIDGFPSFTTTQALLAGMGNRRAEELSIACRLAVVPQDGLKAGRAGLLASLDLIDAALRADHTVGGLVQEAHLGADFSWFQADSSAGDAVSVSFTITGLAYL